MRALYPKTPESQKVDMVKAEKLRQRKMHNLAGSTEKRRQEYIDQVTGSMFAMAPHKKREVEEALMWGTLDEP